MVKKLWALVTLNDAEQRPAEGGGECARGQKRVNVYNEAVH